MAVVMNEKVKPLQELSFTHILMTLEEYAVDDLALFPKSIRNQMLHNLPIVDVCQLEGTRFMAGISEDSMWEKLYKDLIDPHWYSNKRWKEHFLGKIYDTLIKDNRPYGYSRVTRTDKMTDDGPAHKHPMDIVNYLVATKYEEELTKSAEKLNDSESYLRRKYSPANVVMRRHEVTLVKGIVPPGALYNKAQSNQLIPPRYKKFFNEGSCFLPDSAAIELLCSKCQFRPKEVFIHVAEFGTFLENAEHEKGNLSYLAEFFKDVESLNINGEVEKMVVRGAKSRMSRMVEGIVCIEDVPSRVLGLILSNENPKVTSLRISVYRSIDDITESITPVLTSSYRGLKEFHVQERGRVSPDIRRLISITEYQLLLHTISISITEIKLGCFGSGGTVTPQLSYELLQSWIQICFNKPSLYHLKLSLSPVSGEILLKILISFLSTPCSHDQTLTFSYIHLRADEMKSLSGKKTSSSESSNAGEVSSDSLSLHHLDEASTFPYKSLIFDRCGFNSSFTNSVFSLQPVKLKQFDFRGMYSSVISKFFQQPGFDVQSIKISSMNMSTTTLEDYTALLQKESLMSLTFVHCSSINPSTIRSAAKLRGFDLEEKMELVLTREKFIYTLKKII